MSDDNYLRSSCKECGNHIEFPEQSAGTVVTCPHCGQWTELNVEKEPLLGPSNKNVLLIAVVAGGVVIALGIGGMVFFRTRGKAAAEVPPPVPVKVAVTPTNLPSPPVTNKPAVSEKRAKSPEDLKVGPVELEKAKVGSLVYAVGTVTNASEYQRFGVQIELDLYDKNGKKLRTAKDYKDIIEPNRQWQFHALIPDPKTASAKVTSLKEE